MLIRNTFVAYRVILIRPDEFVKGKFAETSSSVFYFIFAGVVSVGVTFAGAQSLVTQ